MLKLLTCSLLMVLLFVSTLDAQQPNDAPFASLEKTVKEEQGGWAGDKSRLSTIFVAERKRLGDRFESELLKWLGSDPERHYWISIFLEEESYLHGSKPLPHLSLLVKQQGLSLVQGKDDEESRSHVVGLSITAAILSDELGLHILASSYKTQAESLLIRYPELSAFVPGFYEAERKRYDAIKSGVRRGVTTTISADSNPAPAAKVSAGIVNGRALKMVKPPYPASAHASGASGTVQVQIVFDETGKVIWARVISGHPDLRQVSEDAAWRTTFSPTVLSGQAVKTSGILIYNFVP